MGRDTNFYYSFLVLPPQKRRAIVAVWDFCRAVDDAVDHADAGAAHGAAERLACWRAELAACYERGVPRTWQARHLQPYVARFRLPRQAFEDVIAGVEMDIGERRYRTFDELELYCRRVASAVGLICIEIFGYEDPKVRDYAVDLGIALQLTNIIRDLAADLARGRLYLPLEDLRCFGCSEADLRAGIVTGPVSRLLAFECGRARTFYGQARVNLPRQEAPRLIAAEIMGAIYRAILDRIEWSGYDVFTRRIRVGRARRAAIAASIWLRTIARLR